MNQRLTASVGVLREIEAICTHFEATGIHDSAVTPASHLIDWDHWLSQIDTQHRPRLARELVAIDAEWKRNHGWVPDASDYDGLIDRLGGNVTTDHVDDWIDDTAGADAGTANRTATENVPVPSSDRYEFRQRIGQGGIGEVWKVWDRQDQRELAMKLLQHRYVELPIARQRHRREALLTGTLQHPGIPPVYDRGELEGHRPYFTMKWVDGQTMATLLDPSPSDPPSDESSSEHWTEHLAIFEQVAQTLAFAHDRGIVHRDLKPHNIMVGRFGEVQVLDWGLAKQIDKPNESNPASEPWLDQAGDDVVSSDVVSPKHTQSTGKDVPVGEPLDIASTDTDLDAFADKDTPGGQIATRLTGHGDVLGTPAYMAPEQARGETHSVDAACDVYSLGAVLFQILTGQGLYQGESIATVMARSAVGDLADAMGVLDRADVPEELRALCRECLRPHGEDRPADAGQVAARIESFNVGVTKRLQQSEIARQRQRIEYQERRKRQRIVVGMSAGLAMLGMTAAAVVWWQATRVRESAVAERIARTEAQAAFSASEEANEFLESILASPMPTREGRDVTLLEAIEDALPRLEDRFADQPEIEARIRRTLGETFRRLERIDEAIDQHRQSVEILKRLDSKDSAQLWRSMDRLAGSLRSGGLEDDLVEARDLRQKIVDEMTVKIGPEHDVTINAMNNLGTVFLEQEDYAAAETIYRDALAIIDRKDDQTRGHGAGIWHALRVNYADTLAGLGRTEEAKLAFEKAIDQMREAGNDEALGNASVLLANLLLRQDSSNRTQNQSLAAQYYQEAIEARSRHFGDDGPLTLSAKRKLTRLLIRMQRYEEAWKLVNTFFADQEKVFNRASSLTFGVRQNWAECLIGLGRLDEAQLWRQETYELFKRERGPDHPATQQAERDLAEMTQPEAPSDD